MDISRRALIAAAGFSILGISGCGSSNKAGAAGGSSYEKKESKKADETTSQEKKTEEGQLDTPYPAMTDKGDLEVTVKGFVRVPGFNDMFQSEGLPGGSSVCLLLTTVKNVSYDYGDQDNPDTVVIADGVYANDPDGATMNPLGSSTDYLDYHGAAGGYADIKEGQTTKEALFYIVPDTVSEVTAVIGNVEVKVPVSQG